MANRNYRRNTMSLEPNPVALYANVSIGASGVATLNIPKCSGIYAMTRTGAGAYTISLGLSSTSVDTYQRVINMVISSLKSTAPASFSFYIVADNSANKVTPSVQIQCSDASGAAVDPSSGTVLLIKIELSNSTAV